MFYKSVLLGGKKKWELDRGGDRGLCCSRTISSFFTILSYGCTDASLDAILITMALTETISVVQKKAIKLAEFV